MNRPINPSWRSLAPWHNPLFWLALPFLLVVVIATEAVDWLRSKPAP